MDRDADQGEHDGLTTLDVVKRAKAGDAASLDEFLARIRSRLEQVIALRVGGKIRSRIDIEDILQEVLLRASRALPNFESRHGERGLWAWLRTLAENQIRDVARVLSAKRRDAEREEQLRTSLREAGTSPSVRMYRQEGHELLLRAYRRLPDTHREVIQLCSVDGMSYHEAAEVLRISRQNVSVRLARAKARLKEVLEVLVREPSW